MSRNDPKEYCPDMPLGDVEVATIIRSIGSSLQRGKDRDEVRKELQGVMDRHLTKDGDA